MKCYFTSCLDLTQPQKGELELEPELNGTAIVVDDDYSTVELFSEFLKIKGIKVIGMCHDGKEAVMLYEKLRTDFVFLDMSMPQFDGVYAFERIKGIDKNAIVIVITADLTKETSEWLAKFHIPYLYKPYEFEDVENIIRRLVSERDRMKSV